MNLTKKISFIILIFSIFLLLSCSAYFNTFYNAETAFSEGNKEHIKLISNYPDSLLVNPPQNVVSKYDRAIDKSKKLLETYKKAKKWHDDAIFLMGKSYFYKREPATAIRCFKQILEEFPTSELVPQVYLYMAKAYIDEEVFDKAEEILKFIESKYPYLNKNHEITALLVFISLKRSGKSQALALLEETYKKVKSEKMKADLMLQTAELYIELKQYNKAISLLKKIPRFKELPLQSFRIDRNLLICYMATSSFTDASQLIEKMIHYSAYYPYMDEMLYRKGKLLYAMGDIEGAIKIYTKLTYGLDTNNIKRDTSDYKIKALVELGVIYQKNKGDYNKAISYFKVAASSKEDSISVLFAKRRLNSIEKIHSLQEKVKEGDSAYSATNFTIGEIFLFELEEPDSAYHSFLRAVKNVSDTAIVPKALCRVAIILREEIKDTAKSDSIFREIIRRYPSSEYAKLSAKYLDPKLTVTIRLDSAKEEYINAEKILYEKQDIKEAIRSFFEIAKKYSDIESIAAKSLFTAAWYTDNSLHKKKTAKMLYEKICEDYPKSIYCQQVTPKLKIVEDTLNKLSKEISKGEDPNKEKQENTKLKESEKKTRDNFTTTKSEIVPQTGMRGNSLENNKEKKEELFPEEAQSSDTAEIKKTIDTTLSKE